MIKNLSQFKKAMNEGYIFEIVEHFVHPEMAGQKRYVSKMQTNSMYTKVYGDPDNKLNSCNNGLGSFIQFGKASDWVFVNGLCQQKSNGNPVWTLRLLNEKYIEGNITNMKKKLIKHCEDVAIKYYVSDGRFYCASDCIVIETGEKLDHTYVENIGLANGLDAAIHDSVMCDVPTVKEIKDNIRNLCGRKLDIVVKYGNGKFVVNARYLYKALEALNATKVYWSKWNKPIIIYENDDPQSTNKELIMPMNSNKVGFYLD